MKDVIVAAILLIGAPLVGRELVHGLRTGIMKAVGVPYATYNRARQPFLFWLAAAYNGAICTGSIVLLIVKGL
ncbi:hypothetical protein [Zavarzinia aquatilis]|uniref:Uncharacterized protein n=1 Tax=Zavarzinia aquatilis TaxID=2211142 RepID=A0A317ECG1_9PROT|nr:hypothetical protein [Zavarzinia aquatilis]PWR22885.1 hypothetical protein DKG74_10720 [Zavarzinia aquatilis]